VQRDLAAGEEVGVDGTPVLFVNGIRFAGAATFEQLKQAIDRELGR